MNRRTDSIDSLAMDHILEGGCSTYHWYFDEITPHAPRQRFWQTNSDLVECFRKNHEMMITDLHDEKNRKAYFAVCLQCKYFQFLKGRKAS